MTRSPLWLRPRRVTGIGALVAVCFLVGHLPVLGSRPASIDAVNFLLGIRDFDPSDHRPHPPGYPVYVALGKASRWAWAHIDPNPADPLKAETRSLAMWASLFGAIGAWPLLVIFRHLGASERAALAALIVTLVSPLFWITSQRPLSDVPGLTIGLIAQALLLTALGGLPSGAGEAPHSRRRPWLAAAGAAAAGISIGVRSQNVWLTVPLLLLVVARSRRHGRGLWLLTLAAGAAGVASWAIPLVIATGGPRVYLDAFLDQAVQDWLGARILATSLTWEQVAAMLTFTFVFPWGTTALAALVLVFAATALVVKTFRSRSPLRLLLAMYGPYLIFHLVFQESEHTRYALPLIPPIAYLAVRGMEFATGRLMPLVAAGTAAALLMTIVPSSVTYAEHGHPAFKAVEDIAASAARLPADRPRPLLSLHHSTSRLLRGQNWPLGTLASPPDREWLEKVSYWRGGGNAPIWLIADATRTDVALFDPWSRRAIHRYQWPFTLRSVLTGARPKSVTWYEINPPGWMVDEGWALTPESGGLTFRDRSGPEHAPIRAYVRRRDEGTIVLVGGRVIADAAAPQTRMTMAIDGRPVDTWDVTPGPFLESWRMPPGALAGTGPYAVLELSVTGGAGAVRVEVDQFDAQSEGTPIAGLAHGWYEMEQDPATGETWRWTGPTADVHVVPPEHGIALHLRAERPAGSSLAVLAGADLLATAAPDGDTVDLSVLIPEEALARAGNVVTLKTTPGPRAARDGLRVLELSVRPAP